MQSVLDQTTMPGASMTGHRSYRVAVENLQQEMFVVELDRPWLDTPFLLQGFLIDSKVELDTLIKHCDYVHVDLELSSPAVADIIRRVEMRTTSEVASNSRTVNRGATAATPAMIKSNLDPLETITLGRPAAVGAGAGAGAGNGGTAAGTAASRPGPPRHYRPRTDVKISQNTRQRFRHFVRQTAEPLPAVDESLLGRWLGRIFKRPERESADDRNTVSQTVTADLLPPGVARTAHQDRHLMVVELPRARQAFSGAEAAIADMTGAVRSGKPLSLDLVDAAVDLIVQSMLENPDALMWIARLREEDVTTNNHGVRVALYLVALGRHLGLPPEQLSHLGRIGMLGDIGKSKLPRAILEKPGMLSPGEFELVKQHVNLTLQVLAGLPNLPPEVTAGIAQHHERIDGSGYPNRLKGKDIGVYGKMAAIADSYAALVTPRAYANALAPQDALMNLYEWSGTSFSEAMVEQFLQAIGLFPVGSMVELATGEIGVVVAHNCDRRLEPRVMVLSHADKSPLAQPVERDLSSGGKTRSGKVAGISRGLPTGAFGIKLRDYYLDGVARSG